MKQYLLQMQFLLEHLKQDFQLGLLHYLLLLEIGHLQEDHLVTKLTVVENITNDRIIEYPTFIMRDCFEFEN